MAKASTLSARTALSPKRRRRAVPVAFDRRGFGSPSIDRIRRAADAAVAHCVHEVLESRQLLAAHVVGSNVSYATIQAAVNAAPAGGTITVDAGQYNETVTINKSLTIDGANAGRDGRGSRGAESIVYATQTVFYVGANNVTIDGFTVQGNDANIGAAQGAGILMAPNINGTIVQNDIIQNNVTGIYLSNNSATNPAIIRNNLIQNNWEYGYNWTLPNAENGSRAIYTDGSVSGGLLTNVLIDNNTMSDAQGLANNYRETLICLEAQTAGRQTDITISNNLLINDCKAILSFNVTNLSIIGNTVTGNQQDVGSGPVRFEGNANRVNIQYNSIYGNTGPGICVDSAGSPGDSSGFVVDNNNIYNNSTVGFITQASEYDGPIWATGDWWGDPSGPAGDGPGTGQSIWANGITGHGVVPVGEAGGGPVYFSPWATSLINISQIPAPAAPAALTATGVTSSSVQLAWTSQMSTAKNQLIQRSTDGGNTWTTIATVSPLVQGYVDGGLTSGVSYAYRVIASNAAGTSAPSATATVTVPPYALPIPPTNLVAIATTTTTATVAWTPPNNGFGVASYAIYRNGVAIATVGSGTPTYTDSGLNPSTAYQYAVATVDNLGAVSALGLQARAITAALAPTGYTQLTGTVIGTAGSYNNSGNTIANAVDGNLSTYFDAQNANGNWVGVDLGAATQVARVAFAPRPGWESRMVGGIIQASTTADFSSGVTNLYTITTAPTALTLTTVNLPATTARYFRYLSPAGGYGNIAELQFFSAGTAATPIGLTAGAVSTTQIQLTWSAPPGGTPTGYLLQRSPDGQTFTNVATLAGNALTYTDTGLTAGATYVYQLIATAAGSSSSPASVTATTLLNGARSAGLSSLAWVTATSGWSTPKTDTSVVGNTLTIRGQSFTNGLGANANSTITYALGGKYQALTGAVGIDDEVPAYLSPAVDFQVYGDGQLLFDSGVVGRASAAVPFAVNVAGVRTLTLVATSGTPGNIDYCHADWAGTTLLANPSVPAVPTGFNAVALAAPGASAGSVNLLFSGDGTQGGFTVQRSTDGGNTWSVLAALPATASSYTDAGLTLGTTYTYRVIAFNAAGNSPATAALAATPVAYQPPVSPSGLQITAVTASTATVTWNAVPNAAGYVVYRNGLKVGASLAGTTTYLDTGLSPGAVYQYTVATTDAFNAVSAPSIAVAAALPAFSFADGSFEATRVIGYAYDPTTAAWAFTGNAGIEANGSPWNAANAPDGNQAAFLQVNSYGVGTLSQTFTVNATGNFALNFQLAQRPAYGLEPIAVSVDGVAVGTYTPGSASFQPFSTSALALSAGTHVVKFATTTAVTAGDSASFLDTVSLAYLTNAAPSAPTGLSAAAVSASQVTLGWTTATGSPSAYTLQRSTNGGSTWTTVTTAIGAAATSYIDSGLAASTAYVYRLVAVNAAGSSAASATASATTLSATLVKTALAGLSWVSATAGYKTPQLNTSILGNPLTIRGTVYASGIGTHAASTIVYSLAGKYAVFTATVGIDDEVITSGLAAVDFQVVGDGTVLFDSGVLTRSSAAVNINVPVAGVKTLTLIATNGVANSIDYDHADWAGATLLANAPTLVAPAAPSGLTAAAVGSNAVALNWTAGDNTQASFKLDRSSNGGNTWSTIATPTGTSYGDTGLIPGTTYLYRVRATNAAGDSANSTAATVTVPAAVTAVPISTLTPTAATAGWGSVQTNLSIKGNTITLGGKAYATGLGTHAPSTIAYSLNGAWTAFSSTIGLDDEIGANAASPVTFQVIGDGQVLYTSPVITGSGQLYAVNVPVTGVKTLQLIVNSVNAGNIDFDHADWAGATLIGSLVTPSAPTNLAVTPQAGLNMLLNWTASPGAATYTIQRSSDGNTFTTIATGVTSASYTDATVTSASTSYYYRIVATNAAGQSSPSAVAAGTSGQLMPVTYLSDLTPASATTGYGSVMADKSVNGNAITLAGQTYAKGIGVHAVSQLTYKLGGKFSTFTSDIGIDQEEDVKGTGSVDFQVWGDGVLLYDSGILTNDQVAHISVNVAGIQQLQLIATNGVPNSIDYDHADWAGAQLNV